MDKKEGRREWKENLESSADMSEQCCTSCTTSSLPAVTSWARPLILSCSFNSLFQLPLLFILMMRVRQFQQRRSTSPHLTSPHLTSPHLTSPHIISPHLISPHLTSPHLTSPHLISSHLISSHLISSHLISPHHTIPFKVQFTCSLHLVASCY